MRFDVITIFPKIFDSYFNESMIKRAQKKKLVKIKIHDLRDYTTDKHRTVDDRPYGGGPGMILKVEPIYRALRVLKSKAKSLRQRRIRLWRKKLKVILLTPQGKAFNQKMAQRFSKLERLILICGHYEGFDERVRKLVDEEVSIGDYVLTGGEVPAMVIVDAVARLVPGVLGHEHALDEETFSQDKDYIEYPQYTRPEIFRSQRVPKVLLSGNHQKIRDWRVKHVKQRGKESRG